MNLGCRLGKKSVLGHGVEDSRLAQELDEDDRGEPGDGPDLDDWPKPGKAHGVDGDGDRGGVVELLVGDDTGHHQSDQDVEDCADEEAGENAYGHVFLRVAGLLGGGGNGVETQIGEEDHSGSPENAADSVESKSPGVGGDKGLPEGGLQEEEAGEDEDENNENLEDNHDPVHTGGLFNTPEKKKGDSQDHKGRREVEKGPCGAPKVGLGVEIVGSPGEDGGELNPQIRQEADNVARPPDSDRGGAEGVFQDQVPSDDPGEKLSQGRVGVGVGASGDGDHGSEFCVAESGEGTGQTGEDQGENDGRPRILGGGVTGENEDSGSDDPSDSDEGQV